LQELLERMTKAIGPKLSAKERLILVSKVVPVLASTASGLLASNESLICLCRISQNMMNLWTDIQVLPALKSLLENPVSYCQDLLRAYLEIEGTRFSAYFQL
jgi:hypothetical protein